VIATVSAISIVLSAVGAAAQPGGPAVPGAATAPAATTPGAVLLRYKFHKGDRYRYKMSMDNIGNVTAGTMTVPMKQHMEIGMTQTVTDIDAATGNATIQVQLTSFDMQMNGKAQPLPPAVLEPLKKASQIVMSPSGKVVTADVPAAGAAMGGQSPWASMQSTPVLPEQAVKPGDSWEQVQQIPGMGMSVRIPMVYTGVIGRGGHTLARINQSMNIDMKGDQAGGTAMPVAQIGTMKGTGSQLFDIDLGLPVSQEMTMHMDTTMAIPNAPRPGAPGNGAAGAPPTRGHAVMDVHMVMRLVPDGA